MTRGHWGHSLIGDNGSGTRIADVMGVKGYGDAGDTLRRKIGSALSLSLSLSLSLFFPSFTRICPPRPRSGLHLPEWRRPHYGMGTAILRPPSNTQCKASEWFPALRRCPHIMRKHAKPASPNQLPPHYGLGV